MAETLPRETGREFRHTARAGFDGLTVGRAPGHVQANLILLPHAYAEDFEAFCHANPLACPLLAVGEPGSSSIPALGDDIDLRSDLPAYLVHAGGESRVTAIDAFWRDDLVAFALGCWFSAEAALAAAGIRMRHVEMGLQGALFRTRLPAASAGRFQGPLVVSMRPFATSDIGRVRDITARLPRSHGAPLHAGDPAGIGIPDPERPDWGTLLDVEPGETALFWACGLTALAALGEAELPFFITHAPGAMLVTDLLEDASP
ncbi:D-glutamate cyclase family protein [Bosea thiooxidans]